MAARSECFREGWLAVEEGTVGTVVLGSVLFSAQIEEGCRSMDLFFVGENPGEHSSGNLNFSFLVGDIVLFCGVLSVFRGILSF